MNSDRLIDSISFEWSAFHAQLARSESQLKELRVTALVMSIVVFFATSYFSIAQENKELSPFLVVGIFSSLWWGMTYFASLSLQSYGRFFDRNSSAYTDAAIGDFDIHFTFRDQAKLLEATRDQSMRVARVTKIVSLLVGYGVLLTMATIGMAFILQSGMG